MQVKRHCSQRRIVGVGKGVDDGVEGVAAENVVVQTSGGNEGTVLGVR